MQTYGKLTFARRYLRPVVTGAVAIGAILAASTGLQTAVANGDTRTLTLHHSHTNEDITITFKRNGQYDAEALKKLNWFLRDWRREEPIAMAPELFDTVWEVYRYSGATVPIVVVSAYRSPTTNAMLRSRSRGVAKHSQHMLGKAMDFYIPGIPTSKLREVGLRLQRGGVGFYPTANTPFVHIDVGSVRMWPRMSRDQLARVFPDGKTVHIPADGHPMPGFELALAELQRNGKVNPSRYLLATNPGATQVDDNGRIIPSTRGPNFLAKLFGFGGDEGDEAEAATPAPAAPRRGRPAPTAIAQAPGQQAPVPVTMAPEPAPTVVAAAPVPMPVARPKNIPAAQPELKWQTGPDGKPLAPDAQPAEAPDLVAAIPAPRPRPLDAPALAAAMLPDTPMPRSRPADAPRARLAETVDMPSPFARAATPAGEPPAEPVLAYAPSLPDPIGARINPHPVAGPAAARIEKAALDKTGFDRPVRAGTVTAPGKGPLATPRIPPQRPTLASTKSDGGVIRAILGSAPIAIARAAAVLRVPNPDVAGMIDTPSYTLGSRMTPDSFMGPAASRFSGPAVVAFEMIRFDYRPLKAAQKQ